MTLRIPAQLVQLIERHAAGELPNECCGLLAGESRPSATRVQEIHPAGNVWEGDRTHHFLIDPKIHLRGSASRLRGLDIVGFYHSHPQGRAVPSALDAQLALPDVSYLIIAVSSDGAGELKSWRLDATGNFIEEMIELA